jgi:nucleotide-binding universal stress UspA family protein
MKFLLATDGSEYSAAAAEFLKRMNLSASDSVVIYHAVTFVPLLVEWEYGYENLLRIGREITPRILETTAGILEGTPATVLTSSDEEYPEKGIVRKAADLEADVIVLGARGTRGISSRIIGGVAKAVALKSDRPVLIVRPCEETGKKGMKILFATDGSSHSEYICNLLSSLPFPEGSEVVILSVLPSSYLDIPERFSPEINNRMKGIVADIREKEMKETDRILAEASAVLCKRFSTVTKQTKTGDPPVEILDAARESGADLIAAGSSGMKGIFGVIGSVSRYLISHSNCSILVGRQQKKG